MQSVLIILSASYAKCPYDLVLYNNIMQSGSETGHAMALIHNPRNVVHPELLLGIGGVQAADRIILYGPYA